MNFAKPQIVKSPFTEGMLAIAYPYTEDGEWMHKEEIEKYYIEKEKVKEVIEMLQSGYIEIDDSFKKLGLK